MPGTLLGVKLRQVEWGDTFFKLHNWDWGINPFIPRKTPLQGPHLLMQKKRCKVLTVNKPDLGQPK